eukprot:11201806-Lingulodinium_polyedra.AAC.1
MEPAVAWINLHMPSLRIEMLGQTQSLNTFTRLGILWDWLAPLLPRAAPLSTLWCHCEAATCWRSPRTGCSMQLWTSP